MEHDLFQDSFPILESELAAFEIIKHGADAVSVMGINYCSRCYKKRFQERGQNERWSSICRDEMDSITPTGILRKYSITGSTDELNHWKTVISREIEIESALEKNGDQTILVLPANCLEKLLILDDYRAINVTYFKPVIKLLGKESQNEQSDLSFGSSKASFNKEKVLNFELTNETSALFFQKLFVEKNDIDKTSEEILSYYRLSRNYQQDITADITNFYNQFNQLEYISTEIYDYDES